MSEPKHELDLPDDHDEMWTGEGRDWLRAEACEMLDSFGLTKHRSL